MTTKQIRSSLERMHSDLVCAIKDEDSEMVTYCKRQIEKLEAMLPEAERLEEEKQLRAIAKQQVRDKAATIRYIQKGNNLYGVTPGGKSWYADHNWYGHTERTLHCYTLHISGVGLVFTSGTLETVLETVAKH